jgi:hypothetical protein
MCHRFIGENLSISIPPSIPLMLDPIAARFPGMHQGDNSNRHPGDPFRNRARQQLVNLAVMRLPFG